MQLMNLMSAAGDPPDWMYSSTPYDNMYTKFTSNPVQYSKNTVYEPAYYGDGTLGNPSRHPLVDPVSRNPAYDDGPYFPMPYSNNPSREQELAQELENTKAQLEALKNERDQILHKGVKEELKKNPGTIVTVKDNLALLQRLRDMTASGDEIKKLAAEIFTRPPDQRMKRLMQIKMTRPDILKGVQHEIEELKKLTPAEEPERRIELDL